ncbi:folate-binding protein YgfZ [Stella sp.]|uniref:CAF17-like 4Fe-4S cluster assembly/insertion protein YgfZ n=1 Tax=Stella sp. TaxID=2912054 RepID=UPI0035AF33BE
MNALRFTVLEGRSVLTVAGPDRRSFLQGLVSNDVERAAPDRAIHAAFLTPQGRFLHDLFIVELGDTLLLDIEAGRRADLLKRLSMYRLRSKVTLGDGGEDWTVLALFGPGAGHPFGLPEEAGAAVAAAGGVAYVDPRLAALGLRAVLPRGEAEKAAQARGFAEAPFADYDRLRLAQGVPDGSRDLPVEKAILLEAGFDELNGVDWQKGCYMGQELTARTKYRGLVRKRLMPVAIEGPVPEPGTPLTFDGKDAGEMRSGRDGLGLALVRLEAAEAAAAAGRPLEAGPAKLVPHRPDWARF